MAEYVEREALFAALMRNEKWGATKTGDFLESILNEDMVRVVRCKNCHASCYINQMFGESLFCTYWGKDTDENGYCHEGG
jgi:hypothetical protein